MQILNPSLNLDRFFERVSFAPFRVLFLDYDGTLSPLQADRTRAAPHPGVEETLQLLLLCSNSYLVFVSGRSVGDLASRIHLPRPAEIWGSHGVERLRSDGRYEIATVSPSVAAALSEEASWIESRGWQLQLERKPLGLALHGRGIAPQAFCVMERDAVDRWTGLASLGLIVQGFDGGVELRLSGRDKGFAVQTVLSELGGEATAAYLGDDLTDEDAFRSVSSEGIGVLVREDLRETAADLWLRAPDEMLDFLARWCDASRPTVRRGGFGVVGS